VLPVYEMRLRIFQQKSVKAPAFPTAIASRTYDSRLPLPNFPQLSSYLLQIEIDNANSFML
jgi:hypothetical protein